MCLTQSCVYFLNRHFFLDNWLLNSDFLKSNAFLIYWPNSQLFLLTKSQILETSIFWDLFLQSFFDKSSMNWWMNWNVKLFNWKITSRHNHYSAYYVLYGTCQISRILKSSKLKKCTIHRIYHQLKKLRNIFEQNAKYFWNKRLINLNKSSNTFEQIYEYFRRLFELFSVQMQNTERNLTIFFSKYYFSS